MFYKPQLNTRVAAAPTTAIVGDKSLDSIELRKKTYSIKPLKHFSPNVQQYKPRELFRILKTDEGKTFSESGK